MFQSRRVKRHSNKPLQTLWSVCNPCTPFFHTEQLPWVLHSMYCTYRTIAPIPMAEIMFPLKFCWHAAVWSAFLHCGPKTTCVAAALLHHYLLLHSSQKAASDIWIVSRSPCSMQGFSVAAPKVPECTVINCATYGHVKMNLQEKFFLHGWA